MGLFTRNKSNKTPIIKQILELIPVSILKSSIEKHEGDKFCSKYKTYDHLVSQMFGQLNKCQTLTDISTAIAVNTTFIADLGLKQSPARSTMSDGNAKRNWKMFETVYYKLLSHYKTILLRHGKSMDIEEIKGKVVKIIDSSTISLRLSLFEWAKFRTAKGGIKIHTCLDHALMLPDLVNISEAAVHDKRGHPQTVFAPGTIIVEDKGYFDFSLMMQRINAENVFVTRIKDNTVYESICEKELPADKDQHILKDELIRLTGIRAAKVEIDQVILRRIVVYDSEKDVQLELITQELKWAASTVAALYKARWDVEIFFKQLKQNLLVKTFTGTSENAVKSQIYIALITYLLLELIKRCIAKGAQAFSNLCEKIRFCLTYYHSLDYVCNQIKEGAVKARGKPNKPNRQKSFSF
ncbi:MAG TPA: IS4 family transposase [Hanamia sp.]|nr:IS4 family transposase [Hanamia sp.]